MAPRTAAAKAKSRVPLSRDRALEVAVRIADTEGLGALTMRRLAQELGVEAMSLYHHVANKEDILDGMVDALFGEIELPDPGFGWRTAMSRRAYSMRAAMILHPWSIPVVESRKAPGPATLRHHDAVLGCLRAGGFSVVMTAHAYSLLDAYIFGFVAQEVQLPFESGEQTAELAQMILAGLPVDAYPHLREFTAEHVLTPGYDYGDEFDFGLELILGSLERALKTPKHL